MCVGKKKRGEVCEKMTRKFEKEEEKQSILERERKAKEKIFNKNREKPHPSRKLNPLITY